MKQLKEALLARQKAQYLLGALDEMRNQGTIDQAHYEEMRAQRLLELNEALATLKRARDQLTAQIDAQQQQLHQVTDQQNDLDLRVRVGELQPAQVAPTREQLERQRASLQASLDTLNTALAAESPDEPLLERPVSAAPSPPPRPSAGEWAPQATTAVDRLANKLRQIPTPPALTPTWGAYLAAGAGGFLFLDIVAIPFGTVLGLVSVRLVQSGIGVFCLLLALAIALAYFIPNISVRSVVQIACSALLLLFWIILLGGASGPATSLAAGFYLLGIGAVAAIVGAIAQLKQ